MSPRATSRALLIAIVLLAGLSTARPAAMQTSPGRIGIRTVDGAAEFYARATGERFVPRGFNYFLWGSTGEGIGNMLFALDRFDPAQIEADFARMAAAGYNTARIFFDQCNDSPNCIAQAGQRGLNGAYLDNMAAVMRIAAEQGIYVMLTSNDLPDGGGYWDLSNQGANAQFEGYRNAHYLTGPGVRSAQLYWDDLLSGLEARDAPFEAVLGWALLNEQWFFEDQPPLSLTAGTVTTANGESYDLADPDQKQAMLAEGTRYYIAQVAEVVRDHDPEGLVGMGFFQPTWPNPTRIGQGWYVDTAALLAESDLDFFDFHAYPTGDLTIEQYAENFGLIGADGTIYRAKPVIMGEVGAFHFAYPSEDAAARAVQRWIADSCAYGWDGWLYWTQVGAPQSVGDSTWGALDGTGLIFDALAPANQPDPCQTTDIPSPNLALGRPATASAALPDEPTSNLTDGTGAQWGAGADAPQWAAIPFAEPASVGEVRLSVAQWPAGETRHQVWATLADGREVLVVTFAGNTAEGDTLDYSLPAPLPQVTGVRVETLQSPSWVAWQEIEVMRATEGDGAAACVVTAPGGANLRGGAGTDFALAGSLPAGRGALVDAQTTGADGFTWWHLADDVPSGIWVRADVVQAGDSCTDVPPFEGGESSQSGTVPVTFTVTAPPDTRPGDTLFLAGSFSEAGLPEWDPGALPLHASGGGQWTLTLDLPPGGVFEYKYTRGGWDTVEKGPACEELANRSLTVASQQDGQPVTDTVARWIDQGCE